MTGLMLVEGGSAALPLHVLRSTRQNTFGKILVALCTGERGEQGDADMPLLFFVGQHSTLEEALLLGEHLFAFYDDTYMLIMPERVGVVQEEDTRLIGRTVPQ